MRFSLGQRPLLLLQLAVTLAILAFVFNTLLAAVLLLAWWSLTFFPIKRAEWVLVSIACCVFTLLDIAVTHQGVFTFAARDVWGLPYYEPFAWGFFYLHATRMLGGTPPKRAAPGMWFALVVAISVCVMPSPVWALGALALLLVVGLLLFHTLADLRYTGYVVLMGLFVEYLGTTLHLWTYHIQYPLLWWICSWSISGLLLYRAALPVSVRLDHYLRTRE